jgi:beta-N-acetylhexosaminidase
VGIDVNCAPLADVARDVTHPVLLNRLYGATWRTVAASSRARWPMGSWRAACCRCSSICRVYGRGVVDSHLDLPRVRRRCEELEAVDFAAFRPWPTCPWG